MPTVLKADGRRFFFYSLEGSERSHIHVEKDAATAKPVALPSSRGLRAHELNRLRIVVIEHRLMFLEAWHAHFTT